MKGPVMRGDSLLSIVNLQTILDNDPRSWQTSTHMPEQVLGDAASILLRSTRGIVARKLNLLFGRY